MMMSATISREWKAWFPAFSLRGGTTASAVQAVFLILASSSFKRGTSGTMVHCSSITLCV